MNLGDFPDHPGQGETVVRHGDMLAELRELRESLRESERNLSVRVEELKERNNTLKGVEERIVANIENLVLPYIKKLKSIRISPEDCAYLDVIEGNLKEIITPFSQRISGLSGLTPKEMQIAFLIRDGKQNKEMAEDLNMSIETIKSHRQNMRKKLGLYNRKANLRSFLLSYMK